MSSDSSSVTIYTIWWVSRPWPFLRHLSWVWTGLWSPWKPWGLHTVWISRHELFLSFIRKSLWAWRVWATWVWADSWRKESRWCLRWSDVLLVYNVLVPVDTEDLEKSTTSQQPRIRTGTKTHEEVPKRDLFSISTHKLCGNLCKM